MAEPPFNLDDFLHRMVEAVVSWEKGGQKVDVLVFLGRTDDAGKRRPPYGFIRVHQEPGQYPI